MTKPRKKGIRIAKMYKVVGEVEIYHTCFDIAKKAWDLLGKKSKDDFGTSRKQSYAMRILVHAYNEGLIDIKEIEKKLQALQKDIWI